MHLIIVSIIKIFKHLSGASTSIGFTASVTSSSSTWNSGTLVFPKIITNVGNGYNPSTGVFTAPIAGEYVFFVNVQAEGSRSIYVNIVLNGVTQVKTLANGEGRDFYDAGPNLAVLTLEKNNKVWVTYSAGQGYHYEGPVTTFSGFLI